MKQFFSPLLIMMAVVVMVAALANRSASAEYAQSTSSSAEEDVLICHPFKSPQGNRLDVVVYRVASDEHETIAEHREHGDVLLNDVENGGRRTCPGNVVRMERW